MTTIPENMRRNRIERGMAVPWGATIDPNGVAHFALNNAARTIEALRDDKCFLCGKPLHMKRWFIGGCRSAFLPTGCYLDPPTHRDCGHYALQTCPFIAAPTYGKEIAIAKAKAHGFDQFVITDENPQKGRPPGDLFVAVEAIGQYMVAGGKYVKPRMPYRRIEFWRHGKQITAQEGIEIIIAEAPDVASHLVTYPDGDIVL